MNEIKVPENRAYKVTLILLVGLAAFSTAMKDLNRLQEMVSSIQEFTSQWRGSDLVTLKDKSISSGESCPNDAPQLVNSSSESGSSDGVASARGIEVETIDLETITKPEVGGKVELVASKKVNRNLPQLVRAKYAPGKHLKEENSVKRRDSPWPTRIEYKKFDREITLDLPMMMVTDIKADALETEVSPDFPLSLLGRINRKQHGKTDNGRREFIFKRFERLNSSRRAS
ncbi:MAG: hypothetical protein ACR2IB_12745 [Pyrinomonadaceae bacterium]